VPSEPIRSAAEPQLQRLGRNLKDNERSEWLKAEQERHSTLMFLLPEPVAYYQKLLEGDSQQLGQWGGCRKKEREERQEAIWECARTLRHEAVAVMILELDSTPPWRKSKMVCELLSRGMRVPPEHVPERLYAVSLDKRDNDGVLPQLLRQTPTLENIGAWLTATIPLPPKLFEHLLKKYPLLSENPWAQLIYTSSVCKIDCQFQTWFKRKHPDIKCIEFDSHSGQFNFSDSVKLGGGDFSSDQKNFHQDLVDVLERRGLYWHHRNVYDGDFDETPQLPAPVVPEEKIQAGNRGAVGNDVADVNGDSMNDSDESADEGNNGAQDREELKQESKVYRVT
jgi:hypothetical protein